MAGMKTMAGIEGQAGWPSFAPEPIPGRAAETVAVAADDSERRRNEHDSQ
jgi:hypothetical protein